MKNILLLSLLFVCVAKTYAQKETFDLINFTPMKGWKKEIRTGLIAFSNIDNKKNTWCNVGLYKSIPSKGDIDKDFESEWQELAVKSYKITEAPQVSDLPEKNGWKIKGGAAAYKSSGATNILALTTCSGYGRVISIVLMTNSQQYIPAVQKMLDEMELNKPVTESFANEDQKTEPILQTTGNNTFTYNRTNFDDGWVSVIKEDWVEVSKPGIKVLLHYQSPKNINDGWNTLVLPRYTIINPVMNDYGTPTWQGINYSIMGAAAKEKATGTQIYVAVFEGPGGNCIEVVADNFEILKKELAIISVRKVDWDPTKSTTRISWAKINDMYGRNKFAISEKDLIGTWYYGDTVRTGNSSNYSKAAVNMITIMTHEFYFSGTGQYKYTKGDGSGFDTKASNIKPIYSNYQGKFSAKDWEIKLQDTKLNSYFFAVKNNRILLITDFNGRNLFLRKVK